MHERDARVKDASGLDPGLRKVHPNEVLFGNAGVSELTEQPAEPTAEIEDPQARKAAEPATDQPKRIMVAQPLLVGPTPGQAGATSPLRVGSITILVDARATKRLVAEIGCLLRARDLSSPPTALAALAPTG